MYGLTHLINKWSDSSNVVWNTRLISLPKEMDFIYIFVLPGDEKSEKL